MKLVLENCSVINCSHLQKAARKIVNRDYPDATSEEIHQHTEEELRKFIANEQTFEYTAVPNRLGGHRWFFSCPKCKTRVGKLFLPPDGSGLEHTYQCKNCLGLKNQSAAMGQNKVYRKVIRPLKRMKEISDRIQRGHLTADKIQILLDEYDKLEAEVKSCPEYRLYAFKKKQGMI